MIKKLLILILIVSSFIFTGWFKPKTSGNMIVSVYADHEDEGEEREDEKEIEREDDKQEGKDEDEDEEDEDEDEDYEKNENVQDSTEEDQYVEEIIYVNQPVKKPLDVVELRETPAETIINYADKVDTGYDSDSDSDGLVDAIDPNPTTDEKLFFTDSDNDNVADASDMHPGENDFSYIEFIDTNNNGVLDFFED